MSFESDDDEVFEIPFEMQQIYWLRRKTDLENLKHALDAKTPELFQKIGHQLKGNAISFGFVELSELGQRMEKLNSDDFLKIAPQLVNELKSWVEKMEPLFKTK